MSKKILYFVGFFLILIFCFSLFGNKGLLRILSLKKEYQSIASNVEKVKTQNEELFKEIKLIEGERSYLEKAVREKLGFVRDDEIVYEFND
ncbi:MAG: septum formation initiator family protein [Deltaproteobacteria bacterium]|nr:septum formation initiator family protein [Deltaproteobacteria bacterium]